MRIADILERKGDHVLTIVGDTTVAQLAERLRLARVGSFVVSHDGFHIEGLVGEHEIVHTLARDGEAALGLPVSAIMVDPAPTCEPHDSVEHVMIEMTRLRARHFPVVEQERLCGIISIGDVVKIFLDDDAREIGVVRDPYATRG